MAVKPIPDGHNSVSPYLIVKRDTIVMMGEPTGEFAPTPCMLHVYVADTDAAYQRALKAGGTSITEPAQQPEDGDRRAGVTDPCGNQWWIATQVKEVRWRD